MTIKITLFYRHAEPAMKMFKVPNNWLVIVEKSEKETSIKCGSEFPMITFKNRDVIRYEIEKILNENVELTYVHNGKRQYNKTLTEGGLLFRDYIKSKLQKLKGDKSNETNK